MYLSLCSVCIQRFTLPRPKCGGLPEGVRKGPYSQSCWDRPHDAAFKAKVPWRWLKGKRRCHNIPFTQRMEADGIRISWDGRGRFLDNIFIERLWRSVKYEEVYLHGYEHVGEARSSLAQYFQLYNTERFHQSLDYKTPHEVYFGEGKNKTEQAPSIHLKEACFLS